MSSSHSSGSGFDSVLPSGPDMAQFKQGVKTVAGKMAVLANGVMNTIQVRTLSVTGFMSRVDSEYNRALSSRMTHSLPYSVNCGGSHNVFPVLTECCLDFLRIVTARTEPQQQTPPPRCWTEETGREAGQVALPPLETV